MLRASYATRAILSAPERDPGIPPCTTAYFMVGGKCSATCAYCGQSAIAQGHPGRLSRVIWPEITGSPEELVPLLNSTAEFRRVCLQVTQNCPGLEDIIRGFSSLEKPLSVSHTPETTDKGRNLLENTAIDKLAISLDCASPQLFTALRNRCWEKTWAMLEDLVHSFPGRVCTHLVAGLGETEEQLLSAMKQLKSLGISWGLFCFFPLAGTPMENHKQLPVLRYRLIQLASFLTERGESEKVLTGKTGMITGFSEPQTVLELAQSGIPFLTSGCSGCNRPFYNERPHETPRNFHRQPTEEEITGIVTDLTRTDAFSGK